MKESDNNVYYDWHDYGYRIHSYTVTTLKKRLLQGLFLFKPRVINIMFYEEVIIMKIIIRNPFITNQRRESARVRFTLASLYAELASDAFEGKIGTKEEGFDYLKLAAENLNDASKLLGFRNIADMAEFMKIHKRLP